VRARKLGLLLVFLAFGGAVETAWNVQHHLNVGASGCRVLGGKFYGDAHRFEQTQRRPLAAGTRVEVANSFGLVESALGEAGELEVSFEKIVYLDGEQRARGFAEGLELRFTEADGVLRVGTNRDEVERRDSRIGFETHLRLRLPPGTPLVVRNDHGRVDVSDAATLEVESSYEPVAVRRIGGDAKLTTRQADVKAEEIQGTLTLSARHGAVEVRQLAGPAILDVEHGDVTAHETAALSLTHRYGDLTAEDVRGELKVTGEHNGVSALKVDGRAGVESGYRDVSLSEVAGETTVTAEHGEVAVKDARGAVVVKSNYGDVTRSRVAGPVELSVEHGGLHATDVSAGLRGSVSGDDAILDGFRGPVDLQASRGGVRLVPKGGLADDVRVVARNGGVRLTVPDASRFTLEASVRSGEIELDEIEGLTLTRSGSDRIEGRIGDGGGRVTLDVEHGDITLEPRKAVPAEAE
jgi:DUF4097 and DUF4098 domain-containing protein YvlB